MLAGLFGRRSRTPTVLGGIALDAAGDPRQSAITILRIEPGTDTGVFEDAARLVRDFAFNAIGVHRIEARAEVDNDRANGALQKMGATREGRLRSSFVRDGHPVDQYLWFVVNTLDRPAARPTHRP